MGAGRRCQGFALGWDAVCCWSRFDPGVDWQTLEAMSLSVHAARPKGERIFA